MLVLARKSLESVVVGNSNDGHPQIKITVLGIRGARVTLGFDVADDVPVHRWEVWERIHTNGNGSKTIQDFRQDKAHGTTGDRYGE